MSDSTQREQGAASALNILLFTASYAPRVGGLETAVSRLAREYRRAGHHVTVVTNRYPRQLPRFERIDGVPVYRILFPSLVVPRSEWRRTHMGKFLLLLPLAPLALLRLWLVVRSCRPDVVNVHYLSSPAVYVALLSALGALPARIVVSCHGSDLTTVPYPTGSPHVSRWILSCAQAVTACSADLAHYVTMMTERIPRGTVRVVYNGTDVDEFAAAAPHAHPRPYILTAGRLVEKKGMSFLIEALEVLRARGNDCDLIIAGSGPEEDNLRALVERLGLTGHVHFEGSVGRARLGALYQGCAAFALSPVWEGFGIVSLEAMSCARPVVAARTGGIPEVVLDGETGLLARPADPVDLADKLAMVLADPVRAAEMGRRGRRRVETQFTWRAVAARYLDSYNALAEAPPQPAPPLRSTPLRRTPVWSQGPGSAAASSLAPAAAPARAPVVASAAAHSTRTVALLAELRRLAATETDTRRLMDRIAEQVAQAIGADYAGVALREADGALMYHGLWGIRSTIWPVVRFPPGAGFLATRAMAEQRSVVVDHLGDNPIAALEEFPWHMSEGGRTALGTPLLHQGQPLGALTAGWRSDVSVSPEQLDLMESAARYTATLAARAVRGAGRRRPARGGAAIPILMYHQVAPATADGVKRSLLVTPNAFAAQMRLLHRLGWRTMRLLELVSMLETTPILPRRRFVLTFDDALQGVAQYAAPLLSDLGFTATVFVPTHFVGTHRALDGGRDHPDKALMSWDDLRRLQEAGFDIGAHTRTHPHLTQLTSAVVQDEVAGSRDDIAVALGRPPTLFAYPYGDWDPLVATAVHDAGFVAACATHFGRTDAGAHRFALPRISISADLDLPRFAYRLAFADRLARRSAAAAAQAPAAAEESSA